VEGAGEGGAGSSGGALHYSSQPPAVPLCSNVQGDSQTGICITIEPGLLLKGDILVRSVGSSPHAGSSWGMGGPCASGPPVSPLPSPAGRSWACPDGRLLLLSAAEVLPQEVSQPDPRRDFPCAVPHVRCARPRHRLWQGGPG